MPEITHFRCKAQGKVLETEFEAPSPMSNVPSISKCSASCCRRKVIQVLLSYIPCVMKPTYQQDMATNNNALF